MGKQKLLFWGGLLLLTAALILALGNLWQARQADQAAQAVLAEMAAQEAQRQEDQEASEETEVTEPPAYLTQPDMEMPTTEIDGNAYIGTLDLPTLNLTLPVMNQWSYANLNIAPCRYKGSAYQNNLILLAHNYRRHFGSLKHLALGDRVTFTDADGNCFAYTVSQVTELPGTAIEEMEAGDWDLTLFTCTLGGKARVTIRCTAAQA